MRKKLIFLIPYFFCFCFINYGQSTIWLEDFNSDGGIGCNGGLGCSSPSSGKWTTYTNGANLSSGDWLKVVDNKMEWKDTDGEAIWESEIITITNYEDVSVSIDWEEAYNGSTDYLRFYYKINGGSESVFSNNGLVNGSTVSGDNNSSSSSTNSLSGNTIQIIVKGRNSSTGDQWRIDNVNVEGTLPECSDPLDQPSELIISNTTENSFEINWTNTSSSDVIVTIKEQSYPISLPSDDVFYSGNTVFGNGDEIGNSNFVLYSGSVSGSPPLEITGLNPNTTYNISIYAANSSCYNTSSALSKTTTTTTSSCTSPSSQISSLTVSNNTSTGTDLSWTNGNGNFTLIVAAESNSTVYPPTQGVSYQSNSYYSYGDQTGYNNYVIYNGTANTVNITGLSPNKTYNFYGYTYNSITNCYNQSLIFTSVTTGSDLNLTNGTFSACGGKLYDDGGSSGNHSNGATIEMTLEPQNDNQAVCVDFTSWSVTGRVMFYDGPSVGSSMIYDVTSDWNQTYSGAGVPQFEGPGMVCAYNGPLTIEFDPSGSNDGFVGDIICYTPSTDTTDTCRIIATATNTSICDGELINLSAIGEIRTTPLSNNFNSSTIGSEWDISVDARFDNPCGGFNGTPALWMGIVPAPRALTTNDYDLTNGGSISFAFMQADDAGIAPCEGPDRQQEGVFFQYSVDGGISWITMSPFYEGWTTYGSAQWNVSNWIMYNYTIPIAARTTATRFRWYQAIITSNSTDHWGLDEIIISSTSTTSITWKDLSTDQIIAASANSTTLDVTVSPSTTRTYRAEITDGTNTCYEDVTINVNNFTSSITEPSSCNANDGEIEISVTGIGPFEFSIDNGISFQSSNIFNGLSAGNYQIVVSDLGPNNCQITRSVTLGNSPHIVTSKNKTICEGESTLLSIDSAYGGSLVEEFDMTFTSSFNYTTTNITNPGKYYIIVSDTFSIIDNENRDAFFEKGPYNNNTWSPNSIWEIDNSDPSNLSQTPSLVNTDHIYQLIINGGNNHTFSFSDTIYSDNFGILNFKIYYLGDVLWPDGSNSLANTISPTTDSIFYTTIDNGTCSSIDSSNITVHPIFESLEVITSCDNYTWIDGVNYTSNNNTATYEYQSMNGCDSIILLDLTISDIITFTETRESCDSLEWSGSTYYSTGEYNQTLLSVNGCDSVVTLDLTINESTNGDTSAVNCDMMTWYGTTYSSSGQYNYTLQNSKGCDSLVTLDLTINLNSAGDTNATVCDNFNWYGNNYSSSGQYNFTLLNSSGCDSVVTLDLTIKQSSIIDTSAVVCDNFEWYGNNYNTSGNYTQTLVNAEGCDSIIELNLIINENTTGDTSAVACNSFNWYGTSYNTSGQHSHILESLNGCDSTVTLNLIINENTFGDTSAIVCDSINWYGNIFTNSGNYDHIIQNSNGCDSIINLNLTVNQSIKIDTNATICDSINWQGNTYYTSGNYSFTSQTINGCDSTVSLNLIVNQSTTGDTIAAACDSIIWYGNKYTVNGNYNHALQTATGCDSIVTMNLTMYNAVTTNDSFTVCDSTLWNGNYYFNSGIYIDTLQTYNGCDSIITLDLTITQSSLSDTTVSSCDSLIWNGNTYLTSGSFEYSTVNENGCDSTITLNLTINNAISTIDTQIACESYQWIDGNTYIANNNTAEFILQTENGCDSTVNLDLIISFSSNVIDSLSECDSLTWIDGNTYFTNNTSSEYLLTNVSGCDSLVNLNLTINSSYNFEKEKGICIDEFPYEWDGLTFNNESSQTLLLNSVNNCDSTINYNLFSYENPEVSININDTSICADSSILLFGIGANSYEWSDNITNNNYYFPIQSGSISVTGIDSNNCSSSASAYIGIDSCYYGEFEIIAPNIFTPDNNGNNDIFYVSGTNFVFKKLSILNRWGETVFKTNEKRPWDGRLNSGQKAPEGTYIYILDITKYSDNIPTDTTYKKTLFLSR